ncbi:MAG: iron ABC transporter permease [Candidatus Accumulibacter phosphatis]|jgi:iron(III) transport system permease protein|uniref:Iron ABC transporter permease n=1 Tax=Candidatus Accumulibacter contiguus TaxID=2954381 RepID=A0ABX1T9F4_9PROT|nr:MULTISPECIES: iron ABC transporter permease [Candidatus Accumulibacter]MBL8408262.1 iron ABC transporter permease [Accumulibacter sp.]NMQ05447.1 iron ABC transporter permease [Candidatus Accumulibacter contiguus]HRF12123.1 iron ABC transporter permease [Candidatus Accumulibacter phosphatis]
MIKPRLNPLLAISAAVAALVGLPVASVLTNILSGGTSATWSHLAATVLPDYVANTLVLCLAVALGVIVVGVATAWLTAMHDFPGRRVFEWALVLPMAMPAYVLAYVYTDFLQFVGPLQSFLREFFGWSKADYWFPEVRSLAGAVTMFVFVLYPYVYLLTRTTFSERASGMLEASRSLGFGSWRSFFRLSLPLARPAIVAGATLALMETLADYGTVSYFGVQTFTTGIYRAWFSLGDRIAAAQLAAALLAFVIVLLLIEHASRGRSRFHNTSGRRRSIARQRLPGWRGWLAMASCAVPLGIGFLLPAWLLLRLALTDVDAQFGAHFVALARNSFLLAGLTAIIAVALAVLLAYGARLSNGLLAPTLNRLVSLGYAVPGSVIAVGVLIPVTRLDHWLAGQWQNWFGDNPGLLITGGIAALVYAYLVRFLAVALQSVGTSLAKITVSMDDAARSLGLGQAATLRRVHLPILRGSLFTACLLVFVDVMKELPATLVMRPFDFDTLATQAYTLASDERLAEAASVSLAIVAVGLLPLIALSRQISHARR